MGWFRAAPTEATPTQPTVVEASSKAEALPTDLPTPEQALNLLQARRTVQPKDFSGAPVPRAVVEACLEAANWAPTHGRTEPWRFVVLERAAQDAMVALTLQIAREKLEPEAFERKRTKLEKKQAKDFPKVSHMVALCQKRQARPEKLMPEWEEAAAVCCAVQNFWLAATALGAAGYWSSWTEEVRESAEFKAYLGLQPEDRCLGIFLLGMARDGFRARQTRGPIEEKVDWRA